MLSCFLFFQFGGSMRLSIDVTPEQHQRLKAVAALSGQTIKEYVLSHVLPETATISEAEALSKLEAFLEPRIKAAESGNVVNKSARQIFEETFQKIR
jgi:hypothetical protein